MSFVKLKKTGGTLTCEREATKLGGIEGDDGLLDGIEALSGVAPTEACVISVNFVYQMWRSMVSCPDMCIASVFVCCGGLNYLALRGRLRLHHLSMRLAGLHPRPQSCW